MPEPLQQREIEALSARRRPLRRGARRGVLPPLRGSQGDVRPRADLRAARAPDPARHGARARGFGRTATAAGAELWKFACEGYLGNFVSEEAERVARTRGDSDRDGRRRGDPLPDAPAAADERGGPRGRASGSRRRGTDLTERAPERPRAARSAGRPARDRASSARRTTRDLYRSFGLPLDDLAEQCRRLLADTEDLWEMTATGSSARASASGSGRCSAGTSAAPVRGAEWDASFPAGGDAARARGNARRPRHRPARAAERRARPRRAPEQRPAGVLLADRGSRPRRPRDQAAGRPERLASALPRGRPHRALRPHGRRSVAGGAAPRRQRRHRGLGDAARAPDHRPGLARAAARLPAAVRVRRRRSGAAPLDRPALLREAPLRARVPFDRGPRRRCSRATSSCSPTRPKVEPAAADYLDDIDAGFYASEYLRAWAFEAQLRAYLRERFGNAWFSRREAGSLLRELWAEGQKPTADELLDEVSGQKLELAAVGDRIREALAAV